MSIVRGAVASLKCYDSDMRALVIGMVMATTLGVAACGSDDASDGAATEDTATEDTGGADSVATEVPDVVGDSVEDATATLEAAGFTLRVVQRDGEDLAVTADFIDNRVNVAVETDSSGAEIVTEVVSTG